MFITRKRFEEEVGKRISERQEKDFYDRRLNELEQKVYELEGKVYDMRYRLDDKEAEARSTHACACNYNEQ